MYFFFFHDFAPFLFSFFALSLSFSLYLLLLLFFFPFLMKGGVFFLFPLKVTLNPCLSNRNDLEIPGYLTFYLFILNCPNPPLHLESELTRQHRNTPGKL